MDKDQFSNAEWKVMTEVWRQHPISVREVFERLHPETQWTYSTVKTMLDRLENKGALSAQTRLHKKWYSPKVTAREAKKYALRTLVDRAFGGAFSSMVHHLVSDQDLSAAERQDLERLIQHELESPPSGDD